MVLSLGAGGGFIIVPVLLLAWQLPPAQAAGTSLVGVFLNAVAGSIANARHKGGGIFHVPVMIHMLYFPAAIATATSRFILAFSSLVGGATHLSLGNVLFGPAVLMGIGAIAGAQTGSVIAKRIRGAVVVRLLSIALILVAARLLMRGS